jgi:hypothetical protein
MAFLVPLAHYKAGKTLNDGKKSKKLNLRNFYHKNSKTSPNSELKIYNLGCIVKENLGERFEFKDVCYRLIALFVSIVLISVALYFFFNLYDVFLFHFLILISNFVIIKANSRKLLNLF